MKPITFIKKLGNQATGEGEDIADIPDVWLPFDKKKIDFSRGLFSKKG